jgi:hypothetical protein
MRRDRVSATDVRHGRALRGWRRGASATLIALVGGVQIFGAPVAVASTPQTITFALPTSDVVGSTLDLSATATSGLVVTFASDTTSTCAVAAAVLTLIAAGACTVTASQAGDADWDPAPDVHDSMTVDAAPPPPPFDPQPQTITFMLPASGYVGATIPLAGTASSGLEVQYASLTPAICATDGTTLALDAVGTCTVRASQPGNQDDWLPAPTVDVSATVKLAPFVTSDGANLGRYALNGPIQSMVIDPATGITYVGGTFSEIGVRTGSVALLNGPASGTDTLMAGSPDVIGSELKTFPDNATGYFVTGHIGSVNGDGVLRDTASRMMLDGKVDTSWSLHTTCGTAELPNWARYPIQWDLGDVLVSNINMAPTASGDSTMGLAFIDKATGVARRTGAGDGSCGASGRIWPNTAVFAPLISCASWQVCSAYVSDVVKNPGANQIIVVATVSRGQTIATQERHQTWLIAYDLTTGARIWSTRLEADTPPVGFPTNAVWEASVRHLVGFGGSILLSGSFPLESVSRSNAEITNTLLVDAATGTTIQRWNQQGEQDVSDPLGADVAGPTACLPVDPSLLYEQWRFVAQSATHAVGYGSPIIGGDDSHNYPVCDYSVTGSGLAARLSGTSLGMLAATRSPDILQPLPSALAGGHYLVGPFDAFDLDTGGQLANWHPSPSSGMVTLAVVGSTIVIVGEATFLKGIPAYHVAALDQDLSPVVGFQSGLWTPVPSEDWFRGLVLDGDQIVVLGRLLGPGGASHMIALDKMSGAVEWTAPSTSTTYPLTLTVNPSSGDLYVGMDANADAFLRRYVRSGDGFAEDGGFTHTFTGLGDLQGVQTWITAVDWIDGRLYVGGQFTSVDGHPRQGLARFTSDGTLDAWAPKLIDEMNVPSGSPIELAPHAFLEVGSNVVVTGRFNWYGPYDGGYPTHGPPVVRIYSATTGALVRPRDDVSWFGSTGGDYGYGSATIDGVVFVALGNSGVAAFDATTFDYLPYLSVRTFPGWGGNAIYAIAARQPSSSPAVSTRTGSVATTVATTGISSLVLGGVVPRWQNNTASNVLELGTGALNHDHSAPVVSAVTNRPRTAGAFVGTSAPWTVAWSAKDTGGSGVARYELSRSRNGGDWAVVSVSLHSASTLVMVTPGAKYRFRIRAIDRAGNVGGWAYGTTFRVTAVSQANASVHYRGTWATSTSSGWWGGTAKSSSTKGSTASFTFTGRSIAWVGLKAATRGKANVYVNGVLKATVNLYSATTLRQRIVWSANYATSATRTITIKVVGTAGRPRVDIDGFLVGS